MSTGCHSWKQWLKKVLIPPRKGKHCGQGIGRVSVGQAQLRLRHLALDTNI